ncbi:MAG: hemolysin III family protein [Clostridia bacterium]|nr:hemolysin III family protein [Clostridia bacterium]
MARTKLQDRALPLYTMGEERFHMITHIVGGGIGVLALVACVLVSALKGDGIGVVGGAVYGTSLIALYTMSSIYHGLKHPVAKRVFQVLDHCAIYFLIAGTYTPILLSAVRPVSPGWAWTLFGLVWGLAALATVLTAIDLKQYAVFSMCCYIGMGWCVLLAAKTVFHAIGSVGTWWLLGGGIAYTVGAVLYGLGTKLRYMHGVFHLFVLLGSVLHLICIVFYVL